MNMKPTNHPFALCLNNTGYEASLELGKVYRTIPDEQAESRGYLRLIDESGEDYAYDLARFHLIELPEPIEQALLATMSG